MKALAIIIATLFVAASPASSSPLYRLYNEMIAPTVRINDNCSGQVVYSKYNQKSKTARTIILTAKHCTTKTNNGKYFEIDIPQYDKGNILIGEKLIFAQLLATDSSDLALLEVTDHINVFTKITKIENIDTLLYIGKDCWASGYALGKSIMVSKGLIGPKEFESVEGRPFTQYLRATAQIAGGNSGGGLYHLSLDGSYKLIGVATAGIPNKGFIAVWTPLSNIIPFLEKWVPSYKVDTASQ